jgi:hypothetical protein
MLSDILVILSILLPMLCQFPKKGSFLAAATLVSIPRGGKAPGKSA